MSKSGEHLGVVDIAFSPEVILRNLAIVSDMHTHFLILKEAIKQRKWVLPSLENKQRESCENEDYFVLFEEKAQDEKYCRDDFAMFLKNKSAVITKKMQEHEKFALYFLDEESV